MDALGLRNGLDRKLWKTSLTYFCFSVYLLWKWIKKYVFKFLPQKVELNFPSIECGLDLAYFK